MNRNNKLLLGVLAFVVACTIGYALFSENITITGTASAEGDFDLSYTCTSGIKDGLPMSNIAYMFSGETSIMKDNNYKNDFCTVSGNTVSFGADLLLPTAARNFTLKITNTGSIDAWLDFTDETSFTFTGERCVGNANDDTYTNCVDAELDGYSDIVQVELLALEYADNTTVLNVNNDQEEQTKLLNDFSDYNVTGEATGLVLEPNESMYLALKAQWDDHIADSGLISGTNAAYYKENISYTFKFKQPKTN